MKTENASPWQIAELMGSEADEHDGKILLKILRRECVVDTDAASDDEWQYMLAEAAKARRKEDSET